MFTLSRPLAGFLFALLLCLPVFAQTTQPIDTMPTQKPPQTQPAITITATVRNRSVRCVSIGQVNQTHLQVFAPDGSQIYDSDFQLGNLVTWSLQTEQGQPLTDGSYLFVVTVKDFNGNLTQKYGTTLLEQNQVSLELGNRDELSSAQAVALDANTLAQVVTSVDRVGVAASTDSATALETTEGQNQNKTKESTNGVNISGTGTQNQVAKWTDNAGTLGDSAITEVGGKVGIGVSNPSYKLVVGPDIGPGLTTSDITVSRGAGQSVSIFAGASGANGMNFGWDQTNLRAFVNAPTQSPITFTHGGSFERMRIDTSGNVGIGTPTPQSKLSVQTSTNSYGFTHTDGTTTLNTYIGGSTSGATGAWFGTVTNSSLHFFTNNSDPRMTINAAGNVGIGTTAPNKHLHVFGASDQQIAIESSDSGGRQWALQSSRGTNNGRFEIIDRTANVSRFSILDTGNVGIGTTAPGAILDVQRDGNTFPETARFTTYGFSNEILGRSSGGTRTAPTATPSGQVMLQLEATGHDGANFATAPRASIQLSAAEAWTGSAQGTRIRFNTTASGTTSTTTKMILTDDGSVGIGTTAPAAKLHISDNSGHVLLGGFTGCGTGLTGIAFGTTNPSCTNYSLLGDGTRTIINAPSGGNISFRINDADKMVLNSDGSFRVFDDLEVNTLRFDTNINQGDSVLCYTHSQSGTNVIQGCGSSIRLKKNIDPFTFGLSLINRLRPVSFDWKSNGKRDIGLIAEDVDEVEPLLATRNDKGEVAGVKYEKLPVVLINAVKEQQAQLEQQQAQITRLQMEKAALTRHNAEQDARLQALELKLQRMADKLSKRGSRRASRKR